MKYRIFLKSAACLGLLLTLAGCGGDSGGGGDSANTGSSQPLADSFMAQVIAVIATSSDDTEPKNTDSITATSPENSEAASVGS